jgi:ubiquinone/menaquinone biosynthesis C-methylase UbiE
VNIELSRLLSKSIFLFLFAHLSLPGFSQNCGYYTNKNFGSYYQEFASQPDLMRFMDIQRGDVIADVGSSDGEYSLALASLYDDVTVYVEDVDPKDLNQKKLDSYKASFEKKKGRPETNQFHLTIGTYTCTNLPDNAFDKILLVTSFHEFTYMDEMLNDLYKKLKEGGKLYILEAFSTKEKVIHCDEGHKGYRIDEVRELLEKHGFYMTKMRSPERTTVDYTNCLGFEKNREHSNSFYQTKLEVEPFIEKTTLFDQKEIVSNPGRVRSIVDSIKASILKIQAVYIGYDSWIRGIGNKWMMKQDYGSAITVFNALSIISPNTSMNHLKLAEAYEANKQLELALVSYKRAQELDPDNRAIQKKIKRLR